MNPLPLLCVDTETTGLRPGFHEVIEIGCVLAEPRTDFFGSIEYVETAARVWRIHPKFPERAQSGALRANGYGTRDWSDAVSAKQAFEEFARMGKGKIFLAQNVTFDWSFLVADSERYGIQLQDDIFVRKLDLMSMAYLYAHTTDFSLRRFSLEAMCEHFGVRNVSAHEALSDARAALEIFKRLARR
jgi:DNA polymerase III epsilon subunit-like protein